MGSKGLRCPPFLRCQLCCLHHESKTKITLGLLLAWKPYSSFLVLLVLRSKAFQIELLKNPFWCTQRIAQRYLLYQGDKLALVGVFMMWISCAGVCSSVPEEKPSRRYDRCQPCPERQQHAGESSLYESITYLHVTRPLADRPLTPDPTNDSPHK